MGRLTVLLCAVAVTLLVADPARAATSLERAAGYLESRQLDGGGFAEPGRDADPGATAWAVLGLVAAGRDATGAAGYLAGQPYPTATDLELRILALDALGVDVTGLARQLEGLVRPGGRIGPTLNSTVWGLMALRAAGRPVPAGSLGYLLRAQERSGGFAWHVDVEPDCDDTAAAIQALRAAGVGAGSKAIRRALAFMATLRNADGGFELDEGRGSNAQSTAWAIQAYAAAGKPAPAGAVAYLIRLQRSDGSFRLSSRYATTPVWITSQVAVALAGRPFPFR